MQAYNNAHNCKSIEGSGRISIRDSIPQFVLCSLENYATSEPDKLPDRDSSLISTENEGMLAVKIDDGVIQTADQKIQFVTNTEAK
jgi:hypothetical protein